MAGDAKNADVLTSAALPLEQGKVYRAVVDVSGAVGLLGASEFTIGKVIEALSDRGFGNVRAWTTAQYAQLPPDWPRKADPPGAGDVFPDWTLRLEGTWSAPGTTLPRQLDDVQSGTTLTVRRAWRYEAAAPGPAPSPAPAPPVKPPGDVVDLWPYFVVGGIALAAVVAIWYVSAAQPRRRALPGKRKVRRAG